MRSTAVVVLHILGWLVFGVGLLSPLTPSEGMPTQTDLLLFAVCPVIAFAACFILSQGWAAKLWATTGIGVIVIATSWLLSLQYRTS